MKKRTAHRAGRRARGAATKRNGLGGSSLSRQVHGAPVAGDVAKKPSRRDTAGVSPIKVAVLADLHVPHHSGLAVEKALRELRLFKPDKIILMGDFLEVESFSTYPRSSPNLTIWSEECAAGRHLLDQIRAAASGADIVYLEGNHENRVVKFVATDPRLLDTLSAPLALGLVERNIPWIPLPTCATIDAWQAPWGVIYLHGVYEGQQAAIQHARFVAREARLKTAVFAHGHTFCAATAEDGSVAIECPWLGDPGSDCHRYTKGKPRTWRHGMLEQLVYSDRVLTTFVPL